LPSRGYALTRNGGPRNNGVFGTDAVSGGLAPRSREIGSQLQQVLLKLDHHATRRCAISSEGEPRIASFPSTRTNRMACSPQSDVLDFPRSMLGTGEVLGPCLIRSFPTPRNRAGLGPPWAVRSAGRLSKRHNGRLWASPNVPRGVSLAQLRGSNPAAASWSEITKP